MRRHFLFIIALVCALYFPIMWDAPVLNYDDTKHLFPLKEVEGVSDYIQRVRSFRILDLQPLRDLSYSFDFLFEKMVRHPTHHITNALYWCLTLLGLFLLLALLQPQRPRLNFILTAWVAIHPLVINSVAWSMGRKHILSAMFIIWATFLWVRIKTLHITHVKQRIFILLLFLSACLSQPINVLWPLWLLYDMKRKPQNYRPTSDDRIMVIALFAVGLQFLVLNFLYYSSDAFALKTALGSKFLPFSLESLSLSSLMLGRYFFQLVLPWMPSVSGYSPTAWMNAVGLLGLILGLIALHDRRLFHHNHYGWILFSALPLLVVSVRPTYHPGWDIYALTTCLGFALILQSVIVKAVPRTQHGHVAAGVFVIGSLLTISAFQVQNWREPLRLWNYAVNTEPTEFNLSQLIYRLINTETTENGVRAAHLTLQLASKNGHHYLLPLFVHQLAERRDVMTWGDNEVLWKELEEKRPWLFKKQGL